MNKLKSASFQRKLNLIFAAVFLIQSGPAIYTARDRYLMFLILWTIIIGHFAAALTADSTVKVEEK